MPAYSLDFAAAHLSALVAHAEAGEEITLARGGGGRAPRAGFARAAVSASGWSAGGEDLDRAGVRRAAAGRRTTRLRAKLVKT